MNHNQQTRYNRLMSQETTEVETKVLKWISKAVKAYYLKSIGVPCPIEPRQSTVIKVFMGEKTWAEACIEIIDINLQGLADRKVKLDDHQLKTVEQRKKSLMNTYAFYYRAGDELR